MRCSLNFTVLLCDRHETPSVLPLAMAYSLTKLLTTILTVIFHWFLFALIHHLLACNPYINISELNSVFTASYSPPLSFRVEPHFYPTLYYSTTLYSTALLHFYHITFLLSSTTTIPHHVHLFIPHHIHIVRDPAQLVVQKRAISAMLANSVLEPSFRSVIASAMAGTVYDRMMLKLNEVYVSL